MRRAFPCAIALLGLVVIAPVLWSGWLGDDAFYSGLDGILGADRVSLWQAMWNSFAPEFFGQGRFLPGRTVEKYLVFYVFTNLFAYKALLVAATLAVLEMFRRCVAAYATTAVANLAALIAVTLLAVRGYHDSILSYSAMPQVVALLVLGSMIAFRSALERRSGPLKVVSIALFAVAALTYEVAQVLSLLYPLLAASQTRSWREALRLSWPYVAVGAGVALFSLAARSASHPPTPSLYAVHLGPNAILRALADQVVAALPLSYYLFDPSQIFSRANLYDFYNNAPVQPLVLLAFLPVAAYALNEAARESVNSRALIGFGAVSLLLAAAPVAFLLKYQVELRPGLGYLPVFYEEFSLALILAVIAVLTTRRFRSRWLRGAWIVAIAVVGTLTQATNARVVREGRPTLEARRALERQLATGLLANVPDGTVVTIAAPQDWIAYDGQGPDSISTRGLFYMYARKRIHLVEPSDGRAAIVLLYDPAALRWSVLRR